jgi:hypothetical protein
MSQASLISIANNYINKKLKVGDGGKLIKDSTITNHFSLVLVTPTRQEIKQFTSILKNSYQSEEEVFLLNKKKTYVYLSFEILVTSRSYIEKY